jgi:extradiol dioxygenase family protein
MHSHFNPGFWLGKKISPSVKFDPSTSQITSLFGVSPEKNYFEFKIINVLLVK